MTIEQTALVVREAIRQAALEYEVLPSQALNPTLGHRKSIAARNRAIRLCFDQGITRHELAEAFRRDARVIRMALERTKPKDDFDKSKAIREAAKARQRVAYTERKAGKGFREIGAILGCSASRARDIYEKAARSANAGWLFPGTHPNRIFP